MTIFLSLAPKIKGTGLRDEGAHMSRRIPSCRTSFHQFEGHIFSDGTAEKKKKNCRSTFFMYQIHQVALLIMNNSKLTAWALLFYIIWAA